MPDQLTAGRRCLAALVGTALTVALVAGCSGSRSGSTSDAPARSDSDAVTTSAAPTGPGSTSGPATSTIPHGSPSPAGSAVSPAGSPNVSTSAAPPIGQDIGFGLPAVDVTGPPTTGAGTRPTFSWKPYPGATGYLLTVGTATDGPLWAWRGSETSVILGGWPTQPPPAAPGPLVSDGDSWLVGALNAQGDLIAVSPIRPVAP